VRERATKRARTQGKIELEKFCGKGWSAIFSLRERAHADDEEKKEEEVS
jgi:hypothetical protein